MLHESGMIRSVAWAEIFPWLMIPRALRLAVSIPVLFVATVGVLLMPIGWWGARWLLPAEQVGAVIAVDHIPGTESTGQITSTLPGTDGSLRLEIEDVYSPMFSAFHSLINPLLRMLRPGIGWSELAYWTLGSVWNLLVWGLLGGIITRMAVMRYGREEREGLGRASRFVARRLLAFMGAPPFILSVVAFAVIILSLVGWLSQFDVGLLLASLLWCFVLLGGLIITILVVGVLLGWPLLWGALSSEEMGDVFEGAQRTFAYLYSRPLHYAFYALLAVVVGSATYGLVDMFAQWVIYFSSWGALWGSGAEEFSTGAASSTAGVVGRTIIECLNQLVLTVASAFRYGFLFAAAGVIYLLVRRDADQIEFDNVHVPGQQVHRGLPPLTADESGVLDLDTAE